MSDVLRDIIARNRAGEAIAIPSVCSAQPDVIKASLMLAEQLDRSIVIEATSNQVNQEGGYTNMQPHEFIGFVYRLAREAQVDMDRIIFGGDHLGPQAWRKTAPELAMAKAHELVDAYVRAGFKKIHLDCSEGCAGEPAQLNDEQTAFRSAALAQTCVLSGNREELMFVIGTEVPPPGGARMDEDGDIPATTAEAAKATLAAHAELFTDMMPLVGGLVVQPGVEFSPMGVHHMPMDRDPGLLGALADWPQMCLEAHSTDYQHAAVYPRLAQLGFAFQKVGPALTFAYRQALYALDGLRQLSGGTNSALPVLMEQVMQVAPEYWQGHYHGTEAEQFMQRHFGYADRIRYYWPLPAVQDAVAALHRDLSDPIPEPLLLQGFAPEVLDRAEALPGTQVQRLIDATIQTALAPYFFGDPA